MNREEEEVNFTENWIDSRNRGLRIAFIGVFSLILVFIIYSRFTSPLENQSIMVTPYLKNLANAVLIVTFASLLSIGYGIYRIIKAEQQRVINTNNLLSYITAAFSDNKFWRIMTISAVGYGIFFGFLSQMFIYKYDVSFAKQGIAIPSVNITPCCNIMGYVPMFAAYLTDHFLVLLIPINVILVVLVSTLVGFNISLNFYALKLTKKIQNTKKITFIGSFGATCGLFIGCPTCAGSLFSALVGFSAGTTLIAAIAPLQTFFILLSIPSLIVSPFLIAREIRTRSTCKLNLG
jgi:hypothetical protein